MLENVKIKNRKYIKMDAFQIVLYAIVTLYCISMLYVLLFGFVNSLKDATDVRVPEQRVRLEIKQLHQGFQGLQRVHRGRQTGILAGDVP